MAIDPFLFHTVIILLSLTIIMKAADNVVDAISRYAKKVGLSDYIIGLVVIAFAASMPEVISSLTGLVLGKEEVMIGTILGTNMVHMALVLGTLAVVGKKLDVECKILNKSLITLWVVLTIPFVLMFLGGGLSRIDGVILIMLFVAYLFFLWHTEGTIGNIKKDIKVRTIWKDAFIFVGSLFALLLAGRWLVFSAISIAGIFSIPLFFIAITVIAVGGAIPDFAVGLKSVLKGHQGIGIGDILGSIVLQFLLFFGLVGIINPISINFSQIGHTVFFLFLGLTFLFYVIHKKVMHRSHGVVMLIIYFSFIAVEIIKIL
jgi:cation:H+ antiporter